MAELPAVGYISDAARTQGEVKTALEDIRDVLAQQQGFESLTISGGVITPLGLSKILAITPEGAAADDLNRIVATNFETGDIVFCLQVTSDNITYKHAATGAGEMQLGGASDYTPGDEFSLLVLQLQSDGDWDERRFR